MKTIIAFLKIWKLIKNDFFVNKPIIPDAFEKV